MRHGLVLREENSPTMRYGLVLKEVHSLTVRSGLVLREKHSLHNETWSCHEGRTQPKQQDMVFS